MSSMSDEQTCEKEDESGELPADMEVGKEADAEDGVASRSCRQGKKLRKCPQGHKLYNRETGDDKYYCDECGRRLPRGRLRGGRGHAGWRGADRRTSRTMSCRLHSQNRSAPPCVSAASRRGARGPSSQQRRPGRGKNMIAKVKNSV